MVLVFILLGILLFLIVLLTLLVFSEITVEIKRLKITNSRKDILVRISLKFLGKISLIFTNLNNEKLRKIRKNMKSRGMNLKSFRNIKKLKLPIKEVYKIVRNIKIKKFDLKVNIGTEDAEVTSYIVAILSSIIGVLLQYFTCIKIDKCKYIVNPLYKGKNEYYINLDGIFCIKIVHIIYSMWKFLRDRRDEKYERTSNRRAYADCNE